MSDPVHDEAARLADELLQQAELMALMMPPSQRPDTPSRLGLEAAIALAIRGELFHQPMAETRR